MILTVTEPRFYCEWTTAKALEELGRKKGVGCRTVWLDRLRDEAAGEADGRISIAVFHAAHLKIARLTTDDVRRWLPSARVVTLGSDSIYYTRKYPDRHEGLLVDPRGYEYVRPEGVDLHLDLMQEVVDAYREIGVASATWMWTASEAGLRLAEEVGAEPAPPRRYDAICYANPNVSAPGGYRPRMTAELAGRGLSIRWGGTTEFVTLDQDVLRSIYRLYRQASVCVGTSSPSWTPCRTMKGWRDWVAPHLGVPLIYDSLPELTRAEGSPCISYHPPLDFFPYEGWDELAKILRVYAQDEEARKWTVRVQRTWAEAHTLEKQFERAFGHYELWK